MNHVLTQLNPADTSAIVAEMQRVDSDQQWGVWGSGPTMTPGINDGWSREQGGRVVNTVGFAGPQQRYTLAIMHALGDEGAYNEGVDTTTRLSEILLAPASWPCVSPQIRHADSGCFCSPIYGDAS